MNARQDAMIVNALVRQALTSAQEVMGENGLNAVLRTSGLEHLIGNFPPDNLEPSISASQYAKLNEAIEAFYGRGGRGMLRRIGKASFQYAVREQAALLGIAGVALKLLPERQRIKFILNSMAGALKKSNPQVQAWVEDSGEKIAYMESTCGICYGRQSAVPICYLYIGSIGEAVKWATGKEHEVIETHCLAKGDPYCRFEVGEARE
jgi:V4R domain-containing protein